MCGIAGIWGGESSPVHEHALKKMCDALEHRGPDGEGYWFAENCSLALGHRRLSIIDLSNNGAQPMHYQDRYSIAFNGEIYNYLEIKQQLTLKGYHFKTDSDTEVLLAAYDFWKTDCLEQLDGMFAFMLFDHERKQLFCARDRFGEKPFYYTIHDGKCYFASEIKAFWAAGIPKHLNNEQFCLFFAEDLVENPLDKSATFYKNIHKLDAASYFILNENELIPNIKKYWEIKCTENSKDLNFEEASETFYNLLEESVNRRMRSDVNVGSSLSGGLDSSSIVALMAKNHSTIHTVSARFKNYSKDEGEYIQLITDRFKTSHNEIWVDESALEQELTNLLYFQDEPFQTGSIFAQYSVYKKAREKGIVVMLDGQGADELLCGYEKDFSAYSKEIFRNKTTYNNYVVGINEHHHHDASLSKKEILALNYPSFYKQLSQIKKSLTNQVPKGIGKDFFKEYYPKQSAFTVFNDLKSTLKYELSTQGLEKLLRFADRNSMASSVEVRLPFLYHKLVEFIFSLKSENLVHEAWSKALLRNSMKEMLPQEIAYRKTKVGFEAPQKNWMEKPVFQDRINDSRKRLADNGFITSSYDNNWKALVASYYLD